MMKLLGNKKSKIIKDKNGENAQFISYGSSISPLPCY